MPTGSSYSRPHRPPKGRPRPTFPTAPSGEVSPERAWAGPRSVPVLVLPALPLFRHRAQEHYSKLPFSPFQGQIGPVTALAVQRKDATGVTKVIPLTFEFQLFGAG